ncbi:helix-turn-helix domain-containing protein [Streptomyces anulatus]
MREPTRRCGRCGIGLSQYNAETLCSACSRASTLSSVPDRAWRDERVQQALAIWDFGQLVRLLRRRAGLTQSAVAALTGFSQAHISQLETGRKELGGREAIIDLLNGLGLPADLRPALLTAFADQPRTGVTAYLDPALPWSADRMVTSLEEAVGGPMKRRSVLATLGGAGVANYVLQSMTAPVEKLDTAPGGGPRVTPPLLGSLQTTTNVLRQMDATSGSGSLLETARKHLRFLVDLMKTGTFDQGTGHQLAAVIADTANQTGWYALDGGERDEAQALFAGALRAAKLSGDSRLRAGALSFLAIHGYSGEDPGTAVTAARTGRQCIQDQDAPALNAMLLTREARGHAKLRDERRAMAALEEASALCAQGRGEDDPHWLYWINPGEILGQRASCFLELGRPAEASDAFSAARGALRQDETRTCAQFLSRAATAQMRAGDADAGAATGHEVLTLVNGIQSARLDDHLRTMLGEARQLTSAKPLRTLLERGDVLLKERAAA